MECKHETLELVSDADEWGYALYACTKCKSNDSYYPGEYRVVIQQEDFNWFNPDGN